MNRIGLGYDIHHLVENRQLIIGGVQIPFNKGLEGHSDADVLCHAIADALLGAVAGGDIGDHFPDNDPQYKNISSIKLLKITGGIVVNSGYRINNIDAVIIAEAPKISPYKEQMIKNISDTLQISPAEVSIKATTNEGFGDVGKGNAIVVHAAVLVESTV